MQSAEKFAADNNLNDVLPLLKKGALAAQNPAAIPTMDDFTDAEKEIFREEIVHKWRQPKILYFTIMLNSIAGTLASFFSDRFRDGPQVLTAKKLPSKVGTKPARMEPTYPSPKSLVLSAQQEQTGLSESSMPSSS